MVVRAELMMDTPMKEMAERTRLTLVVAVWANWRERWREIVKGRRERCDRATQ